MSWMMTHSCLITEHNKNFPLKSDNSLPRVFYPSETPSLCFQFCRIVDVNSEEVSGTSKFSKRDIALLMRWSHSQDFVELHITILVSHLFVGNGFLDVENHLFLVDSHKKVPNWLEVSSNWWEFWFILPWLNEAVEEVSLFFFVCNLDGETRSPFITSCKHENRRKEVNGRF